MTTFDSAVRPRGHFSNAGRFSEKLNTEPEATLAIGAQEAQDEPTADTARVNYRNVNFSGVALIGDGYANADFSGAVLRDSRMQDIDFSGADFSDANLSRVAFTHGHRPSADFRGATLPFVDFCNSNLAGANFTNAHLRRASFRNAHIRGVDFTGADLTGVTFARAISDEMTIWPEGFDAAHAGLSQWLRERHLHTWHDNFPRG